MTLGYAQPTLREGLYSKTSPAFTDYRSDMSHNVKLKGMKVGVMYDADFIKGFGAAVGLNYTFAADGTKWTARNNTYSQQIRTVSTFQAIEIPVDWQYRFEIAQKTYLLLYTGPTLNFEFGTKSRFFTRASSNAKKMAEGTSNWFSEEKYEEEKDGGLGGFALINYNVLWGVGAGFQYKRYFVRGGYDFGLINAYRNNTIAKGNEHVNIRSRMDQWQVKLGIYLWEK